MRPWPIPRLDRTIHLVPDTQGITLADGAARANKVLADMTRPAVPDVAHRFQVGDLIAGQGNPERFPDAIAFMDAMGSGEWWACVGNHDYDYIDFIDPLPADAAANMGMPGLNFTIDTGPAVVLVTYLRADAAWDPNAYDPTWLDDTLTALAGRRCLILTHPPLTGLPDFDVVEPVVAAHPNVVAWVNGHTHQPINIQTLTVGGRELPQIDCGALHYTIPDADWNDPLISLYLTVEDDRLEVRFRDHGAHQWVAVGGQMVWTHPL